MRILLNEDDFIKLTKGEVITKKNAKGDEAEIALSDIGYVQMIHIITDHVSKMHEK